jgi:short-subunit dehydrogenase
MRNVLLTGASAGIGRAVAERLTENGYSVWGTSRRLERLPTFANFRPLEMDLDDMASVRAGVARGVDESGGFDVLINNAGSGIFAPAEALSHEKLTAQFQLLVFAPMELIRLLLPGMRERGMGLVVNVTSLAALWPIPYMGAYSAGKAALGSLSWALEMELCRESIRVVELRPGDIRTNFHVAMDCDQAARDRASNANIARAYRAYMRNMERAPAPARVAGQVLKLLAEGDAAPSRSAVGSVFQSRIAPLLTRIGPLKWTRLALSRYYGLACRRS